MKKSKAIIIGIAAIILIYVLYLFIDVIMGLLIGFGVV